MSSENSKPFTCRSGGRLSSSNRWVRLTKLIPWDRIESRYAAGFRSPTGPAALNARIAVGSLIIKEKLQSSDEETVEQTRENPYLQYFLGYTAFSDDRPFDPSMLVQFRKRVSGAILSQINDLIAAGRSEDTGDAGPSAGAGRSEETEDGDHTGNAIENDGTLLMDATCVPAAVRYPTDLSLLNDARSGSNCSTSDEIWRRSVGDTVAI